MSNFISKLISPVAKMFMKGMGGSKPPALPPMPTPPSADPNKSPSAMAEASAMRNRLARASGRVSHIKVGALGLNGTEETQKKKKTLLGE